MPITAFLVTDHPPLNRFTPFGWYRSRQVYKNAKTGQKIGCVDMSFQYAPAAAAATTTAAAADDVVVDYGLRSGAANSDSRDNAFDATRAVK